MWTPKQVVCHFAPVERRRSIEYRGLVTVSWTGRRLCLYCASADEILPWRDILALRAKRRRVEYDLWVIDPCWLWREPVGLRVVPGPTVTAVYESVPPFAVHGPLPAGSSAEIMAYVERYICDVKRS